MSGGWQPEPKYEQIVELSARPLNPTSAPPGVRGRLATSVSACGASAGAFAFACASSSSPSGVRSCSAWGCAEAAPGESCGTEAMSTVLGAPSDTALTAEA